MLQQLLALMPQAPNLLRNVAGYSLIIIGMIGAAIPIIPGWPGIIIGIAILGRRNPVLRRTHLAFRNSIRQMRRARPPVIRDAGWRFAAKYREVRRMLHPHIVRAERMFGADK
jgi:hypothetical protein